MHGSEVRRGTQGAPLNGRVTIVLSLGFVGWAGVAAKDFSTRDWPCYLASRGYMPIGLPLKPITGSYSPSLWAMDGKCMHTSYV